MLLPQNNLFYNINLNLIEDFVGKGLEDLEARVIRTPLPAYTTLIDDPLRILRSIRFAARFQFRITSDLIIAGSDEKIHFALETKVSKDRIGIEVDQMIGRKHSSPRDALGLIRKMNLVSAVFSLPKNEYLIDKDIFTLHEDVKQNAASGMGEFLSSNKKTEGWYDRGYTILSLLHDYIVEYECNTNNNNILLEPDLARIGYYSALFLPLENLSYAKGKSHRKISSVSKYLFMDMLKLTAKDAKIIDRVHNAVKKFKSLLRNDKLNIDLEAILKTSPEEYKNLRVQIGSLKRKENEQPSNRAAMQAGRKAGCRQAGRKDRRSQL